MFVSCEKEPMPTADFSYRINGKTVNFENKSTNAVSYYWDFGDGETSQTESPTYTYKNEGTYTVELRAYNLDNEKSTKQKDVIINNNNGNQGGNDKDKITKCRIKSYTVKSISFVDDNGDDWDFLDGPDIYMRIYDGDKLLLNNSNNRVEDVTKSDLPFTISLNYTLTDLNKVYTFVLCDYDPTFVEEMYVFDYRPRDFVSDKPSRLYSQDNGFYIEIELEWL